MVGVAASVRFCNVPQTSPISLVGLTVLWIVPVQLILLAFARQFSGLLSFFSIKDLVRLFMAMASSAILVVTLWWVVEDMDSLIPPRGVILIDFVLSFMGLASIRLAIRLYRERASNHGNQNYTANYNKVGIVGAGHSGANLVKDLFIRKRLKIVPKYFFDDNPEKRKSHLHGVPILGKPEILLDTDFHHDLDKLIIALPAASGRRIKEVVNIANKAGLTCEIVPSIEELTTGRVSISKLRKVQIQDLLRRDSVQLQTQNIKHLIQDKSGYGDWRRWEYWERTLPPNLLITTRRRLLLIEQCEVQMFIIEQELVERGTKIILYRWLSDVLDVERMESIFKDTSQISFFMQRRISTFH